MFGFNKEDLVNFAGTLLTMKDETPSSEALKQQQEQVNYAQQQIASQNQSISMQSQQIGTLKDKIMLYGGLGVGLLAIVGVVIAIKK